MRGRRDAVLAHRDAPDLGNLFRNLGRRQHPAMPGLGALADLELHHLDLTVGCDALKFVRIEAAVAVAATEIAGADLPDDVAAILAVIGADAALAGIVREAAFFRPRIERAYRVGAERAKAHRRNVEHRGRIRLAAIGAADGDAEFLAAGVNLRRYRMVHPFIAVVIDVLLGAERPLVEHHLSALIDQRPGVAGKRHAVLFALEEILPHFGADLFQEEAHVCRDRIVAQNRVALLHEVADAEQCEGAKYHDRDHNDIEHFVVNDPDTQQQRRDDGANRENDEARREWKQYRFHGTPQANSVVVIFVGRSLFRPSEQCFTRYLAVRSSI